MYSLRHGSNRFASSLTITRSVILVSVTIIGYILYTSLNQQQIIPKSIMQKVSFQVFSFPKNNKTWVLSNNLIKYDDKQGVLTLHFLGANNKLTITEQLTPDPFTDIPNYYSILLSKLNEYSEIHTSIGTVGLTHPEELKGGQTAVINTRGTLIFAHPDKNLTDDQWRQFFNSMVVAK